MIYLNVPPGYPNAIDGWKYIPFSGLTTLERRAFCRRQIRPGKRLFGN